jgi:hypothetical protein
MRAQQPREIVTAVADERLDRIENAACAADQRGHLCGDPIRNSGTLSIVVAKMTAPDIAKIPAHAAQSAAQRIDAL